MQRIAEIQAMPPAEFQSSPVPKDGCNLSEPYRKRCPAVSILTRPEGRVQLVDPPWPYGTEYVSILTRPEGRVQRTGGLHRHQRAGVSILTRPEGRVQLEPGGMVHRAVQFQSSPVPKDGCN